MSGCAERYIQLGSGAGPPGRTAGRASGRRSDRPLTPVTLKFGSPGESARQRVQSADAEINRYIESHILFSVSGARSTATPTALNAWPRH